MSRNRCIISVQDVREISVIFLTVCVRTELGVGLMESTSGGIVRKCGHSAACGRCAAKEWMGSWRIT